MKVERRFRRGALFAIALAGAGCPDRASGPPPAAEGSAPVARPAPAPAAAPDRAPLALPAVDCADAPQPDGPTEFGVCRLHAALARAKSSAKVEVLLASDPKAGPALADAPAALDARPESYVIRTTDDITRVIGRDAVGAMYGAFELAERLDREGAAALPVRAPVIGAPKLAIRGANPFLVMPDPSETTWWFLEPTFWTEYLDMMARSRLNFLDLHGMYDVDNAKCPNLLLWFATSATFPDVGLAKEQREKNLAMLELVVHMARVRGIRVGLMSYRADLSPYADKDEPQADEPETETYTREAVADLATRTHGLSYFGFRVGESMHKASFFTGTYIAGLEQSHTHVKAYTRTWLTSKQSLLPVLAAAGPDSLVEAKYNGEQFGPPYVVSGGRMAGWKSYSYEEFLTPPDPYHFILQVWAAGTHRVFRYANYARTVRAVGGIGISPRIEGFTFEAPHVFTKQRDVFHQRPEDSFSPWAFRRDELAYELFGRLGYDPGTADGAFRAMLAARVGTPDLWDIVQAASDIVPWIVTANTCGPDHRNSAPELELGGPVGYWAAESNAPSPMPPHACALGHGPLDTFAVAMPSDAADDLVLGRGTSRLSPVDIAQFVLANAKIARKATTVKVDPGNVEARDYVRECIALADLGEWFGHKLRAATALAVYERSAAPDWLEVARAETRTADAAFTTLTTDTAYLAPFKDFRRMHYFNLSVFHWREELPLLAADAESIEAAVKAVRAHPPQAARPLPRATAWLDAPRGAGPGLVNLAIAPADPAAPSWTVTVELANPPPAAAHVNVLFRPFASDGADWAALPATGAGKRWSAAVPGTGAGAMFAVEVVGGPGASFRYPDVRKETPYRALPP
jgi:hypothetical protein